MPWASEDAVAKEELSHSLAAHNLVGRRAVRAVLVKVISDRTAVCESASRDRYEQGYLVSLSAGQFLILIAVWSGGDGILKLYAMIGDGSGP